MRKKSKAKPAEAKPVDTTAEAEQDAREDLELSDDEASDISGGLSKVNVEYKPQHGD
jgi:hypothetical protein